MLARFMHWLRDFRQTHNPKSKWILCFSPHDAPAPGLFLNLGTYQGTHNQAMKACARAVGLLSLTTNSVQMGSYFVRHESESEDLIPVGTAENVGRA